MRLDPDVSRGARPLARIEGLRQTYVGASAIDVLAGVHAAFPGQVALISSFGADAAVLLHMAATIDRAFPVLMLETGMLFPETLAYQRALADRLGLTGIRNLHPDTADLAQRDPDGSLHRRAADACCGLRKIRPLQKALTGFAVTVSGRKRFQTGSRAALEVFEADEGRLRVNPLAGWSAQELRDYMSVHALPLHPLVGQGYPSIGCAPCTTPVGRGEDPRAGRWRGTDKTECGIHFGADGRIRRAS